MTEDEFFSAQAIQNARSDLAAMLSLWRERHDLRGSEARRIIGDVVAEKFPPLGIRIHDAPAPQETK